METQFKHKVFLTVSQKVNNFTCCSTEPKGKQKESYFSFSSALSRGRRNGKSWFGLCSDSKTLRPSQSMFHGLTSTGPKP